jgi:hypothetical protein
MKWYFIYCVGIFGIPVTGVLGIHKATKMKTVAHGKKRWIPSWTDLPNIQRQKFMHATGFTGISVWTNGTL